MCSICFRLVKNPNNICPPEYVFVVSMACSGSYRFQYPPVDFQVIALESCGHVVSNAVDHLVLVLTTTACRNESNFSL